MEANCMIRIRCNDKNHKDIIAKFLSSESRPVLEEEIESEIQVTFRALEYCEEPDQIMSYGDVVLHLYFLLGGSYSDDIIDIVTCLLNAGAHETVIMLQADEYVDTFYQQGKSILRYEGKNSEKLKKSSQTLKKRFMQLEELAEELY